jgi:predicted nucleic acid-binding protein
MKVVIDTNVLLISLPKVSKYRPIFNGLIQGKFKLAVSNEIFQEYIEVIENKTNGEIAQNLAELLSKIRKLRKSRSLF